MKKYLSNYLQIQLLLTLISLPILANSGIPISKMSLIGNFVFIPLISIFLVLSSLVFFSELLYIPNRYLIYLLTKLTNLIELILNTGKKEWLIALPELSWTTYIFILIITILTFKLSTIYRIISLSMLLTISLIILPLIHTPIQSQYVPNTHNKLEIINLNNELTIIDNGSFRYKINPEQYVNYTLKPYLIKKYSNINFNLTLNKPCLRSLKAANALAKALNIKNLTIKKQKLSKQTELYLNNTNRNLAHTTTKPQNPNN